MTNKKHERRGLGRGLSALMSDVAIDSAPKHGGAGQVQNEQSVPVEKIMEVLLTFLCPLTSLAIMANRV